MSRVQIRVTVVFICLAVLGCARAFAENTNRTAGVLDGSGVWRALYCWNAPWLQTAAGLQERRNSAGKAGPLERPDFHFLSAVPGKGWTTTEFDDSTWARRNFFAKYANGESDGRAGGGSASPYLRQLCLRGKFTVVDLAKVGRLWLSLSYRGGVAVYVNGQEIARGRLAQGEIQPGAPAEIYPQEAYLKQNGKPWHWYNDRELIVKDAYPVRVRQLESVPIPANLLRKGTNVLALEIHAAPYPEAFAKIMPEWATCGLIELHLQTENAENVLPNVVRPEGAQVWNASTAEQIFDVSWGDPHEAPKPLSLAGPRNGVCSGRVVVSSDRALKGLRASVSNLKGPTGALPETAVQVWYGKFDAARASRWGGANNGGVVQWGALPTLREDALLESPPEEMPVTQAKLPASIAQERRTNGLPNLKDGAIIPVWVLVEIPKTAAAGKYEAVLTITAEGKTVREIPVTLRVIDWTLPEPAEYVSWLAMIESPEAVALTYEVPLWSEKHCQLVAKSFDWVGKLGAKVLYLPLGAESQYGNEQSLVLWIKGVDNTYTHDFSRLEKYLDLALQHAGKPQFVVAGVWDSCMHVSVPQGLKRRFPRFSELYPATGKVTTADGPAHGTDEGAAFWRPVLTKVQELLVKRGLGEALLLGFCADHQPDEATVNVFHEILPNTGWQGTRHPPNGNDFLPYTGGKAPIRYQANVWGGWDNWDPDTRRVYGWKHPVQPGLRTWLDRGLFDASPICQFRLACEQALLADRHGLGQIGADFWPAPTPGGKGASTMVGRFPSTSEGNLGIYSGQLLYPGPNGPAPSVRYQMMRENIQECEARIFLEKLLLESPMRLPAELAAKAQAVLDERTRWHRLLMHETAPESAISWPYSGWEARSIRLYEMAGEAARAVAGKSAAAVSTE